MEELNKSLRVVKVLKQVIHTMKQNMGHQFKELNLTGPQGMMVGILVHCGKMKITELSEKLGLSNSTVSGIVDRLEKQGIVERIRSKDDRRVVYVGITPEFQKSSKLHFNAIEKKFETMMNKATPEELETILNGLDTLKRLMDEDSKLK